MPKWDEYDYKRIGLNFRPDDADQKKIYEYLKAVTDKRVDFICELISNYLDEYQITSPEQLAKIVRKGNIFDNPKSFTEDQKREIRLIVAEYLRNNDVPLDTASNRVHGEHTSKEKVPTQKETAPKEESTTTSSSLSEEEANVLSDFMDSFG